MGSKTGAFISILVERVRSEGDGEYESLCNQAVLGPEVRVVNGSNRWMLRQSMLSQRLANIGFTYGLRKPRKSARREHLLWGSTFPDKLNSRQENPRVV